MSRVTSEGFYELETKTLVTTTEGVTQDEAVELANRIQAVIIAYLEETRPGGEVIPSTHNFNPNVH